MQLGGPPLGRKAPVKRSAQCSALSAEKLFVIFRAFYTAVGWAVTLK